jgi:hypothetical protein
MPSGIPGYRPAAAVCPSQRVMVDERHDDARGHGSCGLGREMLVRAARPQRIGGHEQQHASMRNRLPSLRLVNPKLPLVG